MKQLLKFTTTFLLPVAIFYVSCKKVANEKNIPVIDMPTINRLPVANAGNDTAILLPASNVILDGSKSTSSGNNITAYAWTKLSGPASCNIANANVVKTMVTNLEEGVYQFELKVTDAGGLFSKDTAYVVVMFTGEVFVACDGSTRKLIAAQLIPIGTLSKKRENIAVVSAGNKILFAGGNISGGNISSVDIFDANNNSWSIAELSQARSSMSTAVLGNKIFFAGGSKSASLVDIYDAATNSWSTANHSISRNYMSGAVSGNKVVFAGGVGPPNVHFFAPPVDIYDALNNTWSVDDLRNRPTGDVVGDAGIAATVIGTKIYFAGNASDWLKWDYGSISSTINIYDAVANTWATSDLSIARGFMASIAIGNKNYWAGGIYKQPPDAYTNLVEIRDTNTGSSAFSCLFQPNANFFAVQKNNKIVFFTSGFVDTPGSWREAPRVFNKFDIFDITTNTSSIGVLPVNISGASIISLNNTIYVAGGYVNGSLSNQVWKLEF